MQCVGNQSRKIAATIQQYMQLARILQKMKSKYQIIACFCGFSWVSTAHLWKQGPCFLEQGHASKKRVLQCSISTKINLHTKIKKIMLTKTWKQNHSRPRQRRQKFYRSGTSTLKCVFYEISEIMYVLMFPRYFRYSIGSTGRIHRDGRR